jgi:hypothetical protein
MFLSLFTTLAGIISYLTSDPLDPQNKSNYLENNFVELKRKKVAFQQKMNKIDLFIGRRSVILKMYKWRSVI